MPEPETEPQSESTSAELQRVQDAATIAWGVWRRTDFDRIDAARSLDDEFASRIATAAYTDSVASFTHRLATKWGVRSLSNEDDAVRQTIHDYDDHGDSRAFLRAVRNNPALVVLEMKVEYQDNDS